MCYVSKYVLHLYFIYCPVIKEMQFLLEWDCNVNIMSSSNTERIITGTLKKLKFPFALHLCCKIVTDVLLGDVCFPSSFLCWGASSCCCCSLLCSLSLHSEGSWASLFQLNPSSLRLSDFFLVWQIVYSASRVTITNRKYYTKWQDSYHPQYIPAYRIDIKYL